MFERVEFFMGRLFDGTRKEHNMLPAAAVATLFADTHIWRGGRLTFFTSSELRVYCFLIIRRFVLHATVVIVAGQLNTTDSYQIMILCFEK